MSNLYDILDKLADNNGGIYYGTSNTAAGTSTKTVVCEDFELEVGATICVKFTNRSTVTGVTYMNVNGTGAKQIRGDSINNSSATNVAGSWLNSDTKLFVYDGTYWQIVSPGILTGDQLSSLESVLGLSTTTGRVYGILNKLAGNAVVESGTDTSTGITWKYRKYADGSLEMWGRFTTTLAISTAVGSIYTTAGEYDVNVPSFVTVTDFLTVEISGGAWVDVTGVSVPPKVRFYAPASYGSAERSLRYYFRGEWA